jgi:hypothetical protein
MKTIFSAFLLLSIFIFSCSTGNKQSKNDDSAKSSKQLVSNQNLNISIFLDVSDRISPSHHPNATMEYYKRDLGYINSVTKAFQNHMLNKKIILMDDKIQLFIDPPPANHEINEIIKSLKIHIDKNNVTKELIENLNSEYTQKCEKMYELAINDNNFVGSDIWGFFKNKINDYCISPSHRNILVIMTDGYAYHKNNVITQGNKSSYLTTKRIDQLGLTNSNWESVFQNNNCGFIVKNSNLDNIEVLVLGINPYKNNPYEEDVIRAFWEKWLGDMAVTKYSIKSADLPSNLDNVIQNFILTP